MKGVLTILFALLFSVNVFAGNSGDDWKLEKDKNEVKIWTLETENSNIKSFRAITTIEASISQLAAVLNDVEAYPRWMSDVKKVKILEEVNNNERYYYLQVDAPWPVSNRDNIVHFSLKEDPSTQGFVVSAKGKADYIPLKEDVVRIQNSMGTWNITQIDYKTSKIVFEYTADPGGELPSWVVNLFIVDGPYTTLLNLKEIVKTAPYKDE
jgi:uncharacterized membrane protein